MAKLIDNFNDNYNDKILICYEESKYLHGNGNNSEIKIEKDSRILLVANENDNGENMWPKKIYFEVNQNNKSNVVVKNVKKCKVVKDTEDDSKWNITPDPPNTQWFSFELSEKDNEEKNELFGEPGATVTVGDEGDYGGGKKEKKKKALKNL